MPALSEQSPLDQYELRLAIVSKRSLDSMILTDELRRLCGMSDP